MASYHPMGIKRMVGALTGAAEKVQTVAESAAPGGEAWVTVHQMTGFTRSVLRDVGDASRAHERAANAAYVAFYVIAAVTVAYYTYDMLSIILGLDD